MDRAGSAVISGKFERLPLATRLPTPVSSFIARERELRQIVENLRTNRS